MTNIEILGGVAPVEGTVAKTLVQQLDGSFLEVDRGVNGQLPDYLAGLAQPDLLVQADQQFQVAKQDYESEMEFLSRGGSDQGGKEEIRQLFRRMGRG